MTSEYSFVFDTDRTFAVAGRGLVFVGRVVTGAAGLGDQLMFIDSSERVSGTIEAIESEGALVDKTPAGFEIGILLTRLTTQADVAEILHKSAVEEIELDAGYFERLLGISFPTRLVNSHGELRSLWRRFRRLIN